MIRFKILILAVLFFSPNVQGQKHKFESLRLQETSTLLSKDIPYAGMLYRFTEDYLNQLVQMTPQEQSRKMKADDVQIEDGALERLNLVSDETQLLMAAKNNRYNVSLANGSFKLIEFSCPMSYQLISQKKLKELESEFIKELSDYKIPVMETQEPDRKGLLKTAPHLYIKKGVSYYLSSINNDLYYIEEKGKLKLVDDTDHIAESVCNMLISEDVSSDALLKLTIRQYGFKTDELSLPLKQWIAYCRDKKCNLYAGIERMGTETLTACLFTVNENFKYNHVMNLEIPYSVLTDKKGEIQASVTIYIPTHNLLTLFEEINLTRKEKKTP